MNSSISFQINSRNLGSPLSILHNNCTTNNLRLYEYILHNSRKRNSNLFNNKIANANINNDTKKCLSKINSFRLRSYDSYNINESDSIPNLNEESIFKMKKQKIKLKNLILLNNNNFKNSVVLPRKNTQYRSLKKISGDKKFLPEKKISLNTVPSLVSKDKIRSLYNSNEKNKIATIPENKNKLNKKVITDNENDLFRILYKQTVNNFNNKYQIIYKSKIPKKRTKILKIFEMLKKHNIMIKLNNENKIIRVVNNRNKVKNTINYNSVLSGSGRGTNKKMVDISIGTEDILTQKILKLKHKFNDKSKRLSIQSLNLVNINE